MTVTIAFVGAGNIAGRHFDTLESREDADVVAVCDVDEDAATAAAERLDAAAYTDWERLFEAATFEALFVCLPPFAHEGQAVAAAERGVDLFVEKPVALDRAYARRVADRVAANDVVAQVGYNWRYSPGVECARDLLAGRTVGYVEGRWWGGVPGGESHWWRHRDRSGGQTVEQATHVFDAARLLAGDAASVTAAGSHRIVDLVDFPDATSATVTHENGALSHVSTTCAAEEGSHGLEVVADGATLEVTQTAVSGVVDGETVDERFEGDPYEREVDAFLEAVRTGDTSDVRAPYADAVETLSLTLAVNEAIESGARVVLD